MRDEWEDEGPGAAAQGRYTLVLRVDETVTVVVLTGTLAEVHRKKAELLAAGPRAVVIEEEDG